MEVGQGELGSACRSTKSGLSFLLMCGEDVALFIALWRRPAGEVMAGVIRILALDDELFGEEFCMWSDRDDAGLLVEVVDRGHTDASGDDA